MKKIIKRLLKKYKYPPEQAKKALETVMRQAELMCGNTDLEELRKAREFKEQELLAAEEKSEYK